MKGFVKLFKKSIVFSMVLALMLCNSCFMAFSTAKAAKAPKLSAKSIALTVGQAKKIKVKAKPAGAKAKWSSADTSVATVNKAGRIKAVSGGNTTVKCKLSYKLKGKSVNKTLKCNVVVYNVVASSTPAPAQATAAPKATASAAPTTAPTETTAPTAGPTEEPLPTTDPNFMEWWKDSKFGMFIHLGSYSYYAQGEWAMNVQGISKEDYQTNISAHFNPVNFDAEDIVSHAKAAGMKYLVITSKHHEGFAMWDTQVESFKDYTGTKTYSLMDYTDFGATGRDILKELKDECDKQGIKFGLYYSILDWNHSSQQYTSYFTTMSSWEEREAYIKDMKEQLKEIVDRYDPSILWFDGDWSNLDGEPRLDLWWTKDDGIDLYNYCKSLNPDVIVNERVCRGFGIGDFECPEETIPAGDDIPEGSWETCRTMNGAWGYNEGAEKNYQTFRAIVQELVKTVSRGGNYLLNIGPKGDGSMTDGSKSVLTKVGAWMDQYGESIYGTSRYTYAEEPKWGKYTLKGNKLYVHVTRWPKEDEDKVITITIPSAEKNVVSIKYMNSDDELEYSQDGDSVAISVADEAINSSDTVIEVELEDAATIAE